MALSDLFKKLAPPSEPEKQKLGIEMGAVGTEMFAGYITDDFNPNLSFPQSIDIYEEMRRSDGTVAAVLDAVKLPILEAEWRVQPASDDKRDMEIAEFVERNLFEYMDKSFEDVLREILTYKDFGFSIFEKVWAVDEGEVRIKKIAFRKQSSLSRWATDDPNVPGITQEINSDILPEDGNNMPQIPMWKLLIFSNNREGDNYEGISVLRPAYKHWYFKNVLYKLDGVKHERGAGILDIGLPAGSSESDKSKAAELGKNFKIMESSYIVRPNKEWDVKLLTAGIADQSAALMNSVQHHDRLIAKTVLAQFMNLGEGSTGSFALSKDQSDFFLLSLRASAKYIASVINEGLIKELVDYNFGKQERYPSLESSSIGSIDHSAWATVLGTLVSGGMIELTPSVRQWIYDMFKVPVQGLDELLQQQEEREEEAEQEPPEPEDDEEEPEEETDEEEGEDIEAAEFADKKKLSSLFRELNQFEQRVKFSEIDAYFTENEETVQEILDAMTEKQRERLIGEVEKIVDNKDWNAINELTLLTLASEAKKIKEIAKGAVERGKVATANELGESVPNTPAEEVRYQNARIETSIDERNRAIVRAVKFGLLSLVSQGIGKQAILFQIGEEFDKEQKKQDMQIVGRTVEDALNRGRKITFNSYQPKVFALQRSEVLDSKACNICMSMDGRIVKPDDPFANLGQVHTNCRGLWVGILKDDEDKPALKQLPKYMKDRFGTVDGTPMTNDFNQLKKPKVTKDSRAQQKIDDGVI